MATSTVEDYLKAILLEQQHNPEGLVPMGQVGAALGVSPGTVTAMVKTLADSGLVTYEPYSGVRLTTAGRQLAAHVLRRHRLIELFLVQVMKMNWSEVHAEAEELEHAVSERLIERMDEMLGFPSTDPHGDPIPDVHGVFEPAVLPSLLTCELGAPLRVGRVADQSREFLQLVERRGLKPGCPLRVESRDEAADTVDLRLEDGTSLSLGFRAASKILVVG
ncbi:MAG TPA: metal-dependent transcriptional regulator [Acidobacteria bacterium]|nr:metal-dependent transcriptional regulator [Acidobacteriota bacterium]